MVADEVPDRPAIASHAENINVVSRAHGRNNYNIICNRLASVVTAIVLFST